MNFGGSGLIMLTKDELHKAATSGRDAVNGLKSRVVMVVIAAILVRALAKLLAFSFLGTLVLEATLVVLPSVIWYQRLGRTNRNGP